MSQILNVKMIALLNTWLDFDDNKTTSQKRRKNMEAIQDTRRS